MSDAQFLDFDTITPRPWKNGRGITRNLFADSEVDFTWKVSIAEITGRQPYSSYTGIRRCQVALGPGGVDLHINGNLTTLPVEGVTVFEGEDEVVAEPESEGFLDLNVMTRRDAWTAEVAVSDDPRVSATAEEVVILVAMSPTCTIAGRALKRLDAVRAASGSTYEVTGRAVVIRLQRV